MISKKRQCPLDLCHYLLPSILSKKSQTTAQQPKCFQSNKLSASIYSPHVTIQSSSYLGVLEVWQHTMLGKFQIHLIKQFTHSKSWQSAPVKYYCALIKPIKLGEGCWHPSHVEQIIHLSPTCYSQSKTKFYI